LGELKRHIGEDRSNARRAIRTLTARGLVEEEREEDGERRVKLSAGARFAIALTEALNERPPTLADVPSRPFDLGAIFDPDEDLDEDELPEHPHGPVETPWINDAVIESAVSDNDNPMSGGTPHANEPSPDEDAVSDNREVRE
jgi:DNA-binding MarR family transcriptional regulator